jgi:hypothetical protein
VLITRSYAGSRTFESAYRVFEFRRLMPKVGTGRGLVQFWGERKRRQRDADDDGWTDWARPDRRDPDGLCTVEIDSVHKILDPRRS